MKKHLTRPEYEGKIKKESLTVMMRVDRRLRDQYKKAARELDTTMTSLVTSALYSNLKSVKDK